jgi:type III restriction enzyme
MVSGIALNLFLFQEKAVLKLLDMTMDSNEKQTIVMKAPTGSGKTIILIDFVDEYLSKVNANTAFIWLCPGKGNLEEQSRIKMQKVDPQRNTQNLFDALRNGFSPKSTTFINWELVTKKGNTAIRDSERKNLFDRISDAHRSGLDFIIIIDEEHSNNTAKAQAIIDAFAAKNIIRVSATAIQNKRHAFFEIDELDVIDEGLITKALYVNEGIENNAKIDDDYDYLLTLADEKRKAVAARYRDIGKNIRPLVLIQFPNGQPETIKAVEEKLKNMGYSYQNGMVSKWMSGDKKDIPDNLTSNDGIPVFLLMKQAISTGWDCPRAKILVKLREGMSEQFEIQTIGRIRRMPEARHYDDDLLDFCYVYTLDEKWKAGLLSSMDKAYETKRLFLKPKCKTFTLEKQTRDLEKDGLGEREVFQKIHAYFMDAYKLGQDKRKNREHLVAAGYLFDANIVGKVLHGKFVRTSSVIDNTAEYITTRNQVDTHKHGIQLLHSVDMIKTAVGIPTVKVKAILERLFRKGRRSAQCKLLSLDTLYFYAFIINNARKLKEDFRAVTSEMLQQPTLIVTPKSSEFHIPEQDFFKYDPNVKNEIEYLSNAYYEYTSGFATSNIRSIPEQLFEKYCESMDDIEWVYKNGDSGQQYFSIVYLDGLEKQWLFYADYIIKKKSGDVWIIETKGGESHGVDKNIDIQIGNKFLAFQCYAKQHQLHWGFVRDKDSQLYINNTYFTEDMDDEHWVPLEDKF